MRWLKLSIGFAVTAGFVWLLAREVDLDALEQAFAGLSVSTVLFALAFLAAGWALRIVRWWWMLRPLAPSLPLGVCAAPFLAGMAVNNVAPLRAGDAPRVLGFRRQLRAPAMAVAGTLVVERVLDVGRADRDSLSRPARPAGRRLPVRLRRGGGVAGGRRARRAPRPAVLAPALGRIRERLRLVHSRPRMLVLIGLSAVACACEGAVFATMAAGIRAGAEPMGPWFSFAAGILATAIPSAPGHVGTFDWFAAQGLEAYGASAEVAIAFALTVHVVL